MTASNLSTKEPSALLAGLTNELAFAEKLILAAPTLPATQFPIFAILHQTSKALPSAPTNPASKQAAAITSFAFSPPNSPTSPSVSSTLGDVAYSTATDPDYTSFEDMSDKDTISKDTFSDKDTFSKDDKDELRDDEKNSKDTEHSSHLSDFDEEDSKSPAKSENTGDDTKEGKQAEAGGHKLGSSEELPEFVFVPTERSSSDN